MAADEDWWASERPPTPVGWSDTDWLRHLETCPPIGYAVRDSLYGTSKAGVLRFCSRDEAGAFAVYASPRPTQTEPSPATPPQVPIPERLLDIIGRYGNARSGGCDEAEIIYRWEELCGAIKQYAAAERERCASLVELRAGPLRTGAYDALISAAAAIRGA
mgnify:FL=1